MFNHEIVTTGEQLCRHLYYGMMADSVWSKVQTPHMEVTRRPAEFRRFFQEALALNLTRRLLVAADDLANQIHVEEASFLPYLEKLIRDWNLEALDTQGRLCRLIRDAKQAKRKITTTLHKQLEKWAKCNHRTCYLCGTWLDFNSDSTGDRFTLDHIWPNDLGGDSIADNLLPCCDSCNSSKKCAFASWAECDVHTFVIAAEPSSNEVASIPGRIRFAIHNRAVRAFADTKKLNLKRAYMHLGPWQKEPWRLDDSDVGDFFNLAFHDSDKYLSYGNDLLRLH